MASEAQVRLLRGDLQVACHGRLWGRGQSSEVPAHIEGLLEHKRKARALKGRERLLAEVPEAEPLFQALARRNELLGPHTSKLLKLLDMYGSDALSEAIAEALERDTPRADSVAYIIERSIDPRDLRIRPLALIHRANVDDLRVENHKLEDYDELTEPDD